MPQRTPLHKAIYASGRRQYEIAQKAGNIREPRLSAIASGRLQATPEERKALARVLRVPIAVLFPEAGA
jgi:hypothetical protein